MNDMQNRYDKKICHYKLYKAHKQWFTAASVLAGLVGGGLLTGTAFADVPGNASDANSQPSSTTQSLNDQSATTRSTTDDQSNTNTLQINNHKQNTINTVRGQSQIWGVEEPSVPATQSVTATLSQTSFTSENARDNHHRPNTLTVDFGNARAGETYRILLPGSMNLNVNANDVQNLSPSIGTTSLSSDSNYITITNHFNIDQTSSTQAIGFYVNGLPNTPTELVHTGESWTIPIIVQKQQSDGSWAQVADTSFTETLTKSFNISWSANPQTDWQFNSSASGQHGYTIYFDKDGHALWNIDRDDGYGPGYSQQFITYANLGVDHVVTHIPLPTGTQLMNGNSVMLNNDSRGFNQWIGTDTSQPIYYQLSGDGIDIVEKVGSDGNVPNASFQLFLNDTSNSTAKREISGITATLYGADGHVIMTTTQPANQNSSVTLVPATNTDLSYVTDNDYTRQMARHQGDTVDANSVIRVTNATGQLNNQPVVINATFPTDGEKVSSIHVNFQDANDGQYETVYPQGITGTAVLTLSDGTTHTVNLTPNLNNNANPNDYVATLDSPTAASLSTTNGVSIRSAQITINPGSTGWLQNGTFKITANGKLSNVYNDGSRVSNGTKFNMNWAVNNHTYTQVITAQTQDAQKPELHLENNFTDWNRSGSYSYTGTFSFWVSSLTPHMELNHPTYYVVLPNWVDLDGSSPVQVQNYLTNAVSSLNTYTIEHHGAYKVLIITDNTNENIDDSSDQWQTIQTNSQNDYGLNRGVALEKIILHLRNANDSLTANSQITWGVADRSFTSDDVTYGPGTHQASDTSQSTDAVIAAEIAAANSAITGHAQYLSQTAAYNSAPINISVASAYYGTTDAVNSRGELTPSTNVDQYTTDNTTLNESLVNATDNGLPDVDMSIDVPSRADGHSQFDTYLTGPVTFINAMTGEDITPDSVTYYTNGSTTGLTADQVSDWSQVARVVAHFNNVGPQMSIRASLPLSLGNTRDNNPLANTNKTIYANLEITDNVHTRRQPVFNIPAGSSSSASVTITGQSTVNVRIDYTDENGATHSISLPDLAKTYQNGRDTINQTDFPSSEAGLSAADRGLLPNRLNVDWANPTFENSSTTYAYGMPNNTASFGQVADYYDNGDTLVYHGRIGQPRLTVNFVDSSLTPTDHHYIVKTESYNGNPGQRESIDLTMPTGYHLADGETLPSSSYTFTDEDQQTITIKVTKDQHQVPDPTDFDFDDSALLIIYRDVTTGQTVQEDGPFVHHPGDHVTLTFHLPHGYQLASGQTWPSRSYTFNGHDAPIIILVTPNGPAPTQPSNQPTNPTSPTAPTNPQPTNPTSPTSPTNPSQPTSPSTPTAPTTPNNPTSPTSPSAPTNPAAPTAPNNSGHAVTPAVSGNRVNGFVQTTQSNPNQSAQAGKKLPQTGNDHNDVSVLGLLAVSFAGLLGFADKKKRQD